ncbi:cellulose synthase [Thiocapsa imhoffii]|uniref:Cellulose synthase n=1 Tax=Thiocapsa imhoffii TaxID=382777 RepID=A0A9X0WKY3_9GAMM|nr:cellulose synthase catalytic subunit [Thiocapsa imhoffii]MBK1646421.1 cellulose synthase [Thiocapsa imhoffii]
MDQERERKRPFFSIVLAAAVIALFLYLIVRTSLFVLADYAWYEKSVGLLLLCAELFIMLHALGYFMNLYHVKNRQSAQRQISLDQVPELNGYPPVAIIVSSFKEPLDILENTLICFYNLTYPNKYVYFLDDTRYDRPGDDPEQMRCYREQIDTLCERIGVNLFRRSWRGAKAGMINDFLDFIAGHPKPGFTFQSFDESFLNKREQEKYIIVFDADMNPLPDFVDPLVAFMEDNPKLAFIQTPQYYTNFETNRVARASGLQQAVFYEYICEGKSEQDAMFCCGTNVIFRRAALMDVGGFDESSVTEDFATSLKFHARGWSSAYLNKVCAFGMGPEDLGAYFKQQFRWALGTVGLFRAIVGAFIRNPRMLSAAKWWEYFLSSTHYFIGWALLIMITTPVIYLFFETPSYFVYPEIYILFFLPYFILTMTLFIYSMSQRDYGFKELGSGIVLQAITLPVYLRASLLAIIGVKGTFGITPKGGSTSLPLIKLWPQISLAALCVGAIGWGISRLYFEQDAIWAVTVNMVWCVYHATLLSAVIYFNHPEEDQV